MTGRFEWHITLPATDRREGESLADELGVVFSQISGCPILGQGDYCYLTGYQRESGKALLEMTLVGVALRQRGCAVLRSKIENIVYDTKTGVNEL